MRCRPRGRERSVDRGTCGRGIEPRNACPAARRVNSGCRRAGDMRKATLGASLWRDVPGPCVVRDPTHVRKHLAREPGDPTTVCGRKAGRPHREAARRTPMTNGCGKSDRLVVLEKSPNKAERTAAEGMEGSGGTKGNLQERNAPRTQGRAGAPSALERVRKAAR